MGGGVGARPGVCVCICVRERQGDFSHGEGEGEGRKRGKVGKGGKEDRRAVGLRVGRGP